MPVNFDSLGKGVGETKKHISRSVLYFADTGLSKFVKQQELLHLLLDPQRLKLMEHYGHVELVVLE